MLRTTNKIVKEKINAHILEQFSVDYGWDSDDKLANLKEQLKMFDHMHSDYKAGRYMAEGGTFLIYYDEQRKFLNDILEQTDTDNDKYSNNQVFDTYCHLIGRQIAELVKE